jgi:hypothetical protein
MLLVGPSAVRWHRSFCAAGDMNAKLVVFHLLCCWCPSCFAAGILNAMLLVSQLFFSCMASLPVS